VANTRSVPTSFVIPTGYFDEAMGRWEHIGEARWDGSRFAFQATHFSTVDCNKTGAQIPTPLPKKGPPTNPPPPQPPPPYSCSPSPCPPLPPPPPDPLQCPGSAATMTGGSVRQSFALPTYRARSED